MDAWVGQKNFKRVAAVLTPMLYKEPKTKEQEAYNQGLIDAISPIALMLESEKPKRKKRKPLRLV